MALSAMSSSHATSSTAARPVWRATLPTHQQQHARQGVQPCHLINSSTPCLACNPATSTAARPVWRATLPPHQQQHALSGVQPCQPSTAARPVSRSTLPTLINSSTPCLACNPANPQQQHALSGVQPCQPSSTAARPVWRATLPPYQQQHALSGVQPCHLKTAARPVWRATTACLAG